MQRKLFPLFDRGDWRTIEMPVDDNGALDNSIYDCYRDELGPVGFDTLKLKDGNGFEEWTTGAENLPPFLIWIGHRPETISSIVFCPCLLSVTMLFNYFAPMATYFLMDAFIQQRLKGDLIEERAR